MIQISLTIRSIPNFANNSSFLTKWDFRKKRDRNSTYSKPDSEKSHYILTKSPNFI